MNPERIPHPPITASELKLRLRLAVCSAGMVAFACLHGIPQPASSAGPSGHESAGPRLDFNGIDKNHDGSIAAQERIAAGMDSPGYRVMDIHGDGRPSAEEFAQRPQADARPPDRRP